ncbi:MAG: hypothetical protein JSS71_06280 [Armatimonadetes bacterium]|nr:hypothetical protein [Armatimonadota bacterium]MBX3107761.1 hypothetical protein [Fimbriimonadaceae bacterium]
MIRIVGVQPSENIGQEFVLLQNQGNMRVNLRGHALVAEDSLLDPPGLQRVFVINQDVDIPAGHHVAIRTGSGDHQWCHKHDGYHIYHFFLNRGESLWNSQSTLMLLAPNHRFTPRKVETLLV